MKFMYHQQYYKLRLDCPICRTGVSLEEEAEEEPVEILHVILVEEERSSLRGIREYIEKVIFLVCMLASMHAFYSMVRV